MRFKSHYVADFSARDPQPITDKLFSERWSPRAFKPTDIPQVALEAIFDAARWSPSCFNEQPWQFITASQTSGERFDEFLNLLVDANRSWAKNASLLGFITAKRHFDHNGKENKTASFDCGAALMAMTMQAKMFGLFTHGMAGLDYEQAYQVLNIDPDQQTLVCGFAVGVLDDPQTLPEPLREKEKPSARRPLNEVWKAY